jgi:biopolymer transport protein ExbD
MGDRIPPGSLGDFARSGPKRRDESRNARGLRGAGSSRILIPMIDIMFPFLLFFLLNADISEREVEGVTPPLARHAPQDEAKANADRITVNVHHDADDPKDPKCPPFVAHEVCRNDAHWHISMSGRRYDFTKDGMAKFAQALAELGKVKPEDPAKGISARKLIIRADRTAPYGYVQKVLEQASVAHIYKIEVGAGVPRGTVVERAETQPDRAESTSRFRALPPQTSNEFHEMKVAVKQREEDGVVERRIGDSPPIPMGPQGDAMIEEAVRAELMRRRPAGVVVIIASDRAVPWQAVVGVMDAAKVGGVEKLEFAKWDETEPSRESRPTTDRTESRPAVESIDASRLLEKLWPTGALGELRLRSGRRSTPIFARLPVLGGSRSIRTATLAYDLPTGRLLTVDVGDLEGRETEHHAKRIEQFGGLTSAMISGQNGECSYAVFRSGSEETTSVTVVLAMKRVRIEVFHDRTEIADRAVWKPIVEQLAARVVSMYDVIVRSSEATRLAPR